MSAPLEGLLAVNKPPGITSADVLRQLQRVFKSSPIFASSLAAEQRRRAAESHNQKRRRKKDRLEVKMGHGGTLDPMASGVLVTGIWGGTKHLQKFLNSTKEYETTLILGAETDTYDALGKVVRWAGWAGVTRERVQETLQAFRGDIMQRPPLYSALRHEGKRFYEYAREGKPLPIEIPTRPVRTEMLELVDFTYEHPYEFPAEETPEEERVVIEAIAKQESAADSKKRPGSPSLADGAAPAKQVKTDDGGAKPAAASVAKAARPAGKPPAITLKMTVTSGFYVRSLVYDLGVALGSAAHMVRLVRTRQGEFALGRDNTFEWEALTGEGAAEWEPRVESVLRAWMEAQAKEGGAPKGKNGPQRVSNGPPKVEEPKVEEPEVEEPEVEEPKVEEPKVEESKVEEPNVEEPKGSETVAEPKDSEALAEPKSVEA